MEHDGCMRVAGHSIAAHVRRFGNDDTSDDARFGDESPADTRQRACLGQTDSQCA